MIRIALFTLLALVAVNSIASERPQNVEVTVPSRATLAEQISLAREYSSRAIRATNDEQRRQNRLAAITAWEAVAARASADRAALMVARLSQADLWMDLRAAENSLLVLNQILPVATSVRNDGAVYRRLGAAYALLNRPADAEAAFVKAETDPVLQHEPRIAVMTLTDAARFFERANRPHDAAKRYARLSRLPNVELGSRAQAALSAARTHVAAHDKDSARLSVSDAEALIATARMRGESPQLVMMLERELDRMRQAAR